MTARTRQTLLVALSIFGCVLATFVLTAGNGFLNFDDPETVYREPAVTAGLSAAAFRWAFTHEVLGHWDPLTTLSHMADCQLYRLAPWGHHLTNALLHAATTALLFVALVEMTEALWPAAFAALLFGMHPLRVESVAWITERKDVLAGLFFALGLWAYARYARKETAGRFLIVAIMYLCGLWSKSIVITFPCVLLLLDFWPLRRWPARRAGLFLEKLPLLGIAALFSIIQMNAIHDVTEAFPLASRAQTALIAYAAYLWKMLWPVDLAAIYPHPGAWPVAPVLASALVLLTVSGLLCSLGRRRPYLIVGWGWYLGMLFPVIGFIQIGGQWMADRYTYLPSIGICIIVAWAVEDLTQPWLNRRYALWPAAAALLLACAAASMRQIDYWHDSERLFRRTLAITNKNPLAHHLLGDALLAQGRTREAMAEYKASFEAKPAFVEGRISYALLREREPDGLPEATAELEQAIALAPKSADAYNNLANALLKDPKRLPEAIARFRESIRLSPDSPETHFNLGNALTRAPDGLAEAAAEYETAVRLRPGFADAQQNLAVARRLLAAQKKQAAPPP